MSQPLIVSVDCSTTACKAFAWGLDGACLGQARRPIPLEHPETDGWEQDAELWWRGLVESLAELSGALGSRLAQVRALTITHQRETFVLTDEHGVPLHRALVWMDARCRSDVARLSAELGGAWIHQASGKPPCTTPSIYKLAYLLRRHPELARARPRLLDVHGFLVWRATGRFATSLASADPLGLVDMRARRWSPELLAAVGLHPSQLPELCEPGELLGGLRDDVASACGLPSGLPVLAGAGDGQSAGLGAGVASPGRAYLNLGTAVVSGVLSDDYRTSLAYRTLYGLLPGRSVLESDLLAGTFLVNWLCDRMLNERPLREGPPDEASRSALIERLQTQAATLPPGADGLVVVPYFNGAMDPYWDDAATGITIGWTAAHGPAHFYRAILEGIALEQRLRLEGLEQAGAIAEVVVLGGGARSGLWCQILADVLERPVVRAASPDATSLGVAVLAAAALNLFSSVREAADAMAHLGERFAPGAEAPGYARLYREVYRELYPTLRPLLGRLAAMR